MCFRILCAAVVASYLLSDVSKADGSRLHAVDLELVLAADNSGSITPVMQRAQRMGFSKAFSDPELQRALFSGPVGEVAIIYFEWAGSAEQRVIVPWTLLSDTADVIAFAALLEGAPLTTPQGETSISEAMYFSEFLLQSNGYSGLRKVVDIASNGSNTEGRPVGDGWKALRTMGATVNALLLPEPGPEYKGPYAELFAGYDGPLDAYFQENVIGGPGAFAVAVDPELGFADAIFRKLAMEVAWVDQ